MYNVKSIAKYIAKHKAEITVVISKFIVSAYKDKEIFDEDGKVIGIPDDESKDDPNNCVKYARVLSRSYYKTTECEDFTQIHIVILRLIVMHVYGEMKNQNPATIPEYEIHEFEAVVKKCAAQNQEDFVNFMLFGLICAYKFIVSKEFTK
jgi:hypothetical protein